MSRKKGQAGNREAFSPKLQKLEDQGSDYVRRMQNDLEEHRQSRMPGL